MSEVKTVRITLVKSMSGRLKSHQACVRGLGLRRMNHTVEREATPENMGMVNRVRYLLKVEDMSA